MKTESAQFEMAAGLGTQLPPCRLPEVVFSGKSNVGKSSLINRILRRKSLARTSNKPGKTATINFYAVDTMRLVDLPGYGYARVSQSEKLRWSELMQTYFESGRKIALVIQLIDIRHPLSAEDHTMLQYLIEKQLPFIVVLTKADKLNVSQRAEQLQMFSREIKEYSDVSIYPFSALSGEGADEIRNRIITAAEGERK